MSSSAHLLPPLFEQGGLDDFQQSGRTLLAAVSPRDDSNAAFTAPQPFSKAGRSQNARASKSNEQRIYFANENAPPASERRLFVTDTSVIFTALQNLVTAAHEKNVPMSDSEDGMKALSKLAFDYVNFCKECCFYASASAGRAEPLQFDAEHYRKLYTCFSLFAVLYLPDRSAEDVPVGDELMEWLNMHFIEPSTEEGDDLSKLDRPWEDANFWSYLTRATLRGLSKSSAFFLDVLSKHPSPDLQRLSRQMIPLLTHHPRLHQFSTEREFAITARRWRDKVKALRIELDRVPENGREDDFENWWECFSDILGLLEGRAEVLKRVCVELGADWKEACIAWGIFVDTTLRRKDLPDVVTRILDEMPPDQTNPEEVIHSYLLLGRPAQALAEAAKLDIWLAAHLADFMEPLELIDGEPDDSEVSLRSQYVLAYAQYLHSNPALWRITVDYMCSCGEIGCAMADEVLVRVPLRLQPGSDDHGGEGSAHILSGNLAGVLQEVSATCFEHKREETRRTICRIAARTFLRERDYGMAVTFCTLAEDWPGLGRVVDGVLDEYIARGPEPFARLVANIAPVNSQHTEGAEHVIFLYRLKFAVRFAEFHQRRINGDLQEAAFDLVSMFREDIAPKAWWAVVLSCAVELLQNAEVMLFTSTDACLLLEKLQEISIRTSQGAGVDYLRVLARTTKSGGEKQALQRLQTVRLALARYYARCGLIGVGGKNSSGTTH